jgi:hypothetical protein
MGVDLTYLGIHTRGYYLAVDVCTVDVDRVANCNFLQPSAAL